MEYVLYGLNNQKCCPNRSMSANKLYSTNQCIVTMSFLPIINTSPHLSPLSLLLLCLLSPLTGAQTKDAGLLGGSDEVDPVVVSATNCKNLATESTRFTGLVVVGLLWKRRRLILAAGQSTVGQRVGCFGSAVYMGVWAMI